MVTLISETTNDYRFEAIVMRIDFENKRKRGRAYNANPNSIVPKGTIINQAADKICKLPLKKKRTPINHRCGDWNALTTSVQLNLSFSSSSDTEPACFRVKTMYSRSFSVKKDASSGERGRRKNESMPKTKVKMPSCHD